MDGNDNMFSSDEDDDVLLELGTRPPRATQLFPSDTQAVNTQYAAVTQAEISMLKNAPKGLQDKLNAALGEASVLRDKLSLIDRTRKQEEQLREQQQNKINEAYKAEENKLRQTIQRLEDEKKLHAIGAKTAAATSAFSSPVTPISGNTSRIRNSHQRQRLTHQESVNSPVVKKRKVSEQVPPSPKVDTVVPMKLNRVTRDESSDFFDAIMTHKTIGTDITTMDILSKLKLDNIRYCEIRGDYNILKDESVGKYLTLLFMECMRTLKLDESVDILLKNIATLIKEISFNDTESKVAVPFLIEIIFQIITFRPSAVTVKVLKDTFTFSCDIIKKYQNVLKEPLVNQPDERILQPQVFQFELIQQLIIFNTFDLIEMSMWILQSHVLSADMLSDFFDPATLKSLDAIYILALPISFKINIRVVFNMVEILNTIANMHESVKASHLNSNENEGWQGIPPSWWKECLPRLLSIVDKDIPSTDIYNDDDVKILFFNQYHDSFGLIRSIGRNTISEFIPKLIDRNTVRSRPMVISKDDVDIAVCKEEVDFEFEQWGFALKKDILNIFDSLIDLYPNDAAIIGSGILSSLTRTMAKEQECLLQRNVGQNSPNIMLHQELVENTLVLIFQIWTNYRESITTEQMNGIENELLMSLWRIMVSNNNTVIDPKRSKLDINDHSALVDSLESLSIQDDIELYEDAFEDMPTYMEEEINTSMEKQCLKIMQVRYGESYVAMAREIFESEYTSLGTIEVGDSLYRAMGL